MGSKFNTDSTVILRKGGEIFLVPPSVVDHVISGHTDIRQSTGSVFVRGVDPIEIFNELLFSDSVQQAGYMRQVSTGAAVGWDALKTGDPSGLLIKFEAPPGSNAMSAVLAPARTNPEFGSEATLGNVVSGIAPMIRDARFLPDDVKDDPEILAAMRRSQLFSFVTAFPGASIVNGYPVPRVSKMNHDVDKFVFEVHPDNACFIAADLGARTLSRFIKHFNESSLRANAADEGRPIEDIKREVQQVLEAFQVTEIATVSADGLGAGNEGRRPNLDTRGRRIALTDASLEAFWGWFADSKTIDSASGRPIAFVHGTRPGNDIGVFELVADGHEGVYATPSEHYAVSYTCDLSDPGSGCAGAMYLVYVRMLNPYVVEVDDDSVEWESFVYRGLDRRDLIQQGYDGAILKHKPTGEIDQIIAFYPQQIKSAFSNPGTYSLENPHITDGYEVQFGREIVWTNEPGKLAYAARRDEVPDDETRPQKRLRPR